MWVLAAQVCLPPNILHCHFNLHIFLYVYYTSILKREINYAENEKKMKMKKFKMDYRPKQSVKQ